MPGESRDPYERMLGDALDSIGRAHDAIHSVALELNTAKSERATIFRHLDSLRSEVKAIDKAIRGNGDGARGLRGRIEALEEGRGAERWKALAQIATSLGTALALYLQFKGG